MMATSQEVTRCPRVIRIVDRSGPRCRGCSGGRGVTPAPPDFRTDDLGECKIVSPLRATRFMDASKRLVFRADIDELRAQFRAGVDPPAFELAGPRESIYF